MNFPIVYRGFSYALSFENAWSPPRFAPRMYLTEKEFKILAANAQALCRPVYEYDKPYIDGQFRRSRYAADVVFSTIEEATSAALELILANIPFEFTPVEGEGFVIALRKEHDWIISQLKPAQ